MNNRRIIQVVMSTLTLLLTCFLGVSQAAEILVNSDIIDQAMDVVGQKYEDSAVAQEEITRLQNSASSTFEEFKRANDNLESLSNRVWRYHSFGYKIKQPSFYRLIKLSLKQFKFLMQRFLENLIKLNFYYIYISLQIFLKFISLELKNYLSNKK